ncbi:HEAT repeat domain-containing protein [Polaribacter batillariae]|uniref:HEAT repeat domain-containing protein n=1 Tax=Polaribacter batillariae TaxID=2808900 RepID=A0ABX7SZ74_9FLAO|nr:zf-HC2 domain-containing protein [Polaribacter batillariae]QTD39004.1 HEAT repeat domain-containing protein [Polaribacter batillariae]
MKKCSEIQENLSEYIEGSLLEVANSNIKKHLNTCDACQKEFNEMKSFLSLLDEQEIDYPSTNLKTSFEKMLATEIKNRQPKVVQLQPKEDWKSFIKVAASIAIVISAFLFGKYQSNISRIANVKEENKQDVLTMLENNSASKRILAVTNAEEFSNKDTKIIQAIINRLFFDKNVNVRLAAAETLSKFSSEKIVRDALIKSLETEKNASVQIELIQVLAKIQEKRAIKPMEKILANDQTPDFVKQEVQINLSTLL